MNIQSILKTSLGNLYQEHISVLVGIPENYLDRLMPNKQLLISNILEEYNSEVGQELVNYGERIKAEVVRIIKSVDIQLDEKNKTELNKIYSNYIKPDLYTQRFNIFIEIIERRLASYGIKFEREKYRLGIPKSLSDTFSINHCRKIISLIDNEIDLISFNSGINSKSKFYNKINKFYTKHPLLFWGLGLAISISLGAALV